MSVITQLIANVFESMEAKKSTFMIHEDEISLSSTAKFFGTLNLTSDIVDAKGSAKYPHIISSIYHLPADLLSRFRTVYLSKPDTESILKMYFVIHGFTLSDELAKTLNSVYALWTQLAIVEIMPSLRLFCSLIADAGDHLDKLKATELALAASDVTNDPEAAKEHEGNLILPADSESGADIITDNESIPLGIILSSPFLTSYVKQYMKHGYILKHIFFSKYFFQI